MGMTITQKIAELGKARLIGTYESNTPEWHAAREGIGGSDIGAIMGKNPWKSAYTLWAEKSNLIGGTESNLAMRLGTALEQPIRDFWVNENKDWLTVHETGTWQSVEHAHYKANPDGIIEYTDGTLAILEIKHSRQYWDKLPEAYELQVLWYMHVLGLKTAIVVALAAGDLKEFKVEYDPELAERLETAVRAFYGCLEGGVAPEYDGSDSTYETVREISDGLTEGEIELDKLYENLYAAKIIFEKAEENLNLYKATTLAYMNGIKTGLYKGDKVINLRASKGRPFITFTEKRN
jgi:putative phage-type endonuclease